MLLKWWKRWQLNRVADSIDHEMSELIAGRPSCLVRLCKSTRRASAAKVERGWEHETAWLLCPGKKGDVFLIAPDHDFETPDELLVVELLEDTTEHAGDYSAHCRAKFAKKASWVAVTSRDLPFPMTS